MQQLTIEEQGKRSSAVHKASNCRHLRLWWLSRGTLRFSHCQWFLQFTKWGPSELIYRGLKYVRKIPILALSWNIEFLLYSLHCPSHANFDITNYDVLAIHIAIEFAPEVCYNACYHPVNCSMSQLAYRIVWHVKKAVCASAFGFSIQQTWLTKLVITSMSTCVLLSIETPLFWYHT